MEVEIHHPLPATARNVRFLASVAPGLHLLIRGLQAALLPVRAFGSSPGRKLVNRLRLLLRKGDKAKIPSPAPQPMDHAAGVAEAGLQGEDLGKGFVGQVLSWLSGVPSQNSFLTPSQLLGPRTEVSGEERSSSTTGLRLGDG